MAPGNLSLKLHVLISASSTSSVYPESVEGLHFIFKGLQKEGQCFDKLSTDGGVDQNFRTSL